MGATFWVVAAATNNFVYGLVQAIYHEEQQNAQPQYNWNWCRRDPICAQDLAHFFDSWSTSYFNSGGGSMTGTGSYMNADDYAPAMFSWEPPSVGMSGIIKPLYIYGQVTLNDGVTPVANATVLCFNSATNLLESTSLSDSQGNYMAPCYSSGNHYLVVYQVAAPDIAGTTVNTLTPQT